MLMSRPGVLVCFEKKVHIIVIENNNSLLAYITFLIICNFYFQILKHCYNIMGKARADGKPRGRMSSYAFFVQTCREEHKKKHPSEKVVFAEFTKKCAEKWKVSCIELWNFTSINIYIVHSFSKQM
jgi:hypothetical protein